MKSFDTNKGLLLSSTVLLCTFAFFMTRRVFFSVSGPVVVDYWAFAAGIFLIGEGLWKILNSRDIFLVNLFRLLRVSIGVCIFTIHTLQFIRDNRLGG
jgi:hypothetical protein